MTQIHTVSNFTKLCEQSLRTGRPYFDGSSQLSRQSIFNCGVHSGLCCLEVQCLCSLGTDKPADSQPQAKKGDQLTHQSQEWCTKSSVYHQWELQPAQYILQHGAGLFLHEQKEIPCILLTTSLHSCWEWSPPPIPFATNPKPSKPSPLACMDRRLPVRLCVSMATQDSVVDIKADSHRNVTTCTHKCTKPFLKHPQTTEASPFEQT